MRVLYQSWGDDWNHPQFLETPRYDGQLPIGEYTIRLKWELALNERVGEEIRRRAKDWLQAWQRCAFS